MDLTALIKRAESFLQNFYKNLYNHHRAIKPSISLNQAFEAAAIFDLETVAKLRSELQPKPEADQLRRLFGFIASGFIRRHLLPFDQKLARYYDQLSWPHTWAEHDALSPGQPLPTRPNNILLAELALLYEERWQQLNTLVTELGFDTPLGMYAFTTGLDPILLKHAAQAYLEQTASAYLQALASIEQPMADRWQLENYLRGETYRALFPAAELVPAMEDTLYHLGLDVTHQPNLALEVNQELSSRLSLAFPVRVPEEIYVCISPVAGIDAFENILGLGGMVMPRLLLSPKHDWLYRRLFDPALDAAYAELFTGLMATATWRNDILGSAAASDDLQAFCRLRQLYRLRLAAARVCFAVDRCLGRNNWATIFEHALGVKHPPSAQVIDMGHMRNAFDTWRGMQVGARFAGSLADTYGPTWYRHPDCGEALHNLFQSGPSRLEHLTALLSTH